MLSSNRSETGTSYSSLEKAFDQVGNGSWNMGNEKTWTYTYTETANCPLHSATESVYTVGAGSDPGPCTASTSPSNPPVYVTGRAVIMVITFLIFYYYSALICICVIFRSNE